MSSAKVGKFCERDKKKLDEMGKKLGSMTPKDRAEYDALLTKYERECVKTAKGVTRGMGSGAFMGGARRMSMRKNNKKRSTRRR
jgi:hypothetical protein